MTKDEALRLALEALEYFSDTSPNMAGKAHAEDAITAIKAALEAKDEPVAWLHKETGLLRKETISSKGADWDENHWKPLYITPPQRKPLTDEEIDAIEFKALGSGPLASFRDYARRIEAAHGINGES